jgi:hypothetical protein
MDIEELKDLVQQNSILKGRLDELTSLQSQVKKSLNSAVNELGEADDKGHIVVEINDEVSGINKVMRQRRVSKSLDIHVAEELLAERGLQDKCIKMVPVLDEDEIMSAYYEGLITEQDIDTMFPAKVTWALVMK